VLEAKTPALAGFKGYITNLRACPDGTPVTAGFVIGAYHQLLQIEKSFRMSKYDLEARPRPNRLADPQVRAHHSPLPRHPDPGRSHTVTAADLLPDDLRDAATASTAI
jgi:hypothetical protein